MSTLSAEQTRDHAIRGGLIYLAARMVLQGFQWVSTLLVARLLLPEHYGLMAVVALVTELASLISSGGFGTALVQKASTTPRQEHQLFTLSLLFTAVTYLCVWLAAPFIAEHLQRPVAVPLLRVAGLVLWLVPLNTVCGAIVERELRFSQLAAIQLSMGILQSVVVLTLAFAGFGVWALASGIVVGSVFYSAAIWHRSQWRIWLAWPDAESMPLMRFGATIAVTNLVWFINTSTDKTVVTALMGPAALGLYALAYQLAAMPVDRITYSINRASFPTYGRLRHEPERLNQWYLRMVAALFATTAPVLVGSALVAGDGFPLLLGEKWRDIAVPFQMLAPAGALMAIAATVSPLLNALGRPDIPMKYEMTGAVVYPLSMFIGGELFGLVGVCAVWILVYPLMVAGLVHFSREVTGLSIGRYLRQLAPFAKSLLAMVAAVLLVRTAAAELSPLARLSLLIGVGAAVYTAAALLFVGPSSAMAALSFMREVMSRKSES